jgi:hypothetical protein
MVYTTQNYWVFRLCPSSCILETTKHVSEIGSVSVLRWRGRHYFVESKGRTMRWCWVSPMLTWINPPSTFICEGPWRMWYIVENHRHWRHYGKKLKRRVPLSQWTPWPRLRRTQSSEVSTSWWWTLWTLISIQHASQPCLSVCIKFELPINYLSRYFVRWSVYTFWGPSVVNLYDVRKVFAPCFPILRSWRWRQYVPPKPWWTEYRIVWHYILGDSNLRVHLCEHLNSTEKLVCSQLISLRSKVTNSLILGVDVANLVTT